MYRPFAIIGCMAVAIATALAAGATLTPKLGGADPNPPTSFNDDNGFLEYRRGDNPTWAEAWGRITDNDATLTDAASARITDNKEWSGVITGVDDGFWKIDLDAVIYVGVSTHAENDYEGPLHATARGVLCAWGDVSGIEAIELSSKLGEQTHQYDIDEEVNGLPVVIADGGTMYRAGSPLTTVIKSDHVVYSTTAPIIVDNLITKFTYESRAVSDMLVTLTGEGQAFAEANSRHGTPYAAQEWEGDAEAWEVMGDGDTKLIQKFTLD